MQAQSLSQIQGAVNQREAELRSADPDYAHLESAVRENVKFRGGNHANWSHQTFPDSACVIAIEFKKFFMDEWSGEVFEEEFKFIREALESTFDGVTNEVRAIAKRKHATR